MFFLIVTLCVTGCAGVSVAVNKAAEVADDTRVAAEFTLCRGITVGAWVRAYGKDRAKAEAWQTLCSESPDNVPATYGDKKGK